MPAARRRRAGLAVALAVAAAMLGVAVILLGRTTAPPPDIARLDQAPIPPALDQFEPAVRAQIEQAAARVRADADDAAAWLELAMIYEAYLLLDPARLAYEQSLLRDPSNPRAWYHLALMRVESGDLDGGIDAMRHVIALDSNYAPAHLRLGLWLLDRDDLGAAEQAFITATKTDPAVGPGGAWLGLARVAMRREQPQQAVDLLRRSLAASPTNAVYARQLLAAAYRRMGRHDDAATALHHSSNDPARGAGRRDAQWIDDWQYEVVRYRRDQAWQRDTARALAEQGRFDQALSLIEPQLLAAPNDAELLLLRGTIQRAAGRLEEALTALRRAVELDPSSDEAHFTLAVALYESLQSSRGAQPPRAASRPPPIDEVLTHLERALALNPRRPDGWSLRGQIMLQQGRFDDSIAAYQRAAALDPSDPVWPFHAGLAQLAAGRWSDAAATFEPITKSSPDFVEAWRGLGIARMKLGDLPAARHALDQALALAPDDPKNLAAMREWQALTATK